MKYDVDTDRRIAAIQVLRGSSLDFADAVAAGVRAARFIPARSSCRPIAQSAVPELWN